MFRQAPVTHNESNRLAALAAYAVLDTPAEKQFDDLVKLASEICGTPIALISLVDVDRQWFKAKVGVDAPETARDISVCQYAIQGDDLYVVQDTHKDDRFKSNPLVTESPKMRFYAGAPLITPEGNRIGTICVLDTKPRELTAQQKTALQILSAQVVTLLELRLSLHEQAQNEQKLIDASNAKTEFLASMSHEIRTPMNAIIGLANVLNMSSPLTAKQKEFIEALKVSADALLSLINGLLDISKIEARTIELEHIPFNITKLIDEIHVMLDIRIKEKGLRFTQDSECTRARQFVGDPTRVRQVLLNLCSNAIKFTESGGIHLSVTCDKTSDPKIETVNIAVKDTGIGIPADKLDTIFEKFVQADVSITRKYGGTGLGLAITKTIAEIMGGTITVESTVGKGSIFTVSLPLHLADVDSTPPADRLAA